VPISTVSDPAETKPDTADEAGKGRGRRVVTRGLRNTVT